MCNRCTFSSRRASSYHREAFRPEAPHNFDRRQTQRFSQQSSPRGWQLTQRLHKSNGARQSTRSNGIIVFGFVVLLLPSTEQPKDRQGTTRPGALLRARILHTARDHNTENRSGCKLPTRWAQGALCIPGTLCAVKFLSFKNLSDGGEMLCHLRQRACRCVSSASHIALVPLKARWGERRGRGGGGRGGGEQGMEGRGAGGTR